MMELDQARILISNDDGIDAPGIAVLETLARRISDDVWVCAPKTEQSGTGHSLTLRRPLRIEKYGEKRFAVDGTPTDSVMLGIQQVMRDTPPDLVLSGINRGGNLGEDVTYSGTVAAAMEATLLGVPAIAFSQFIDDGPVDFAPAERYLVDLTRSLVKQTWPAKVLVNVNFPDVGSQTVSGIRLTHQGQRKIGDHIAERFDPRGAPYYWIGAMRRQKEEDAQADIVAVQERAISITPISLDLTHYETLSRFRTLFP